MSGTMPNQEPIKSTLSDTPTIDIRPPVSVYATYRRLNYLPWYAIAEFVDNSTQNYYEHKDDLLKTFKENGEDCLYVKVQYDSDKNCLIIADNANGMEVEELTRAIVLNRPPPNTGGRSEYGMGLKTAACWFGRKWSIETKRLGSNKKYIVSINVQDCIDKKIESVPIAVQQDDPSKHYTVITISDLYKPLKTRTHQRIKDQLSSMYRQDLRTGEINIWWNGIPLQFNEPPILTESRNDGTSRKWQKDISFEVSWEAENKQLNVYGWIGIRNPGSQRDAGFVLFRRGRVIVGGPDTGYKPLEIFGQGNTFRSQRLIGEIHMDDWPVSQSKDIFDWSGGLEDEFVDRLKEVCKEYMEKAEDYRQMKEPPTEKEIRTALKAPEKIFADKGFAEAISSDLEAPHVPRKIKKEEEKATIEAIKSISRGPIVLTLKLKDIDWTFKLHWQDQVSDAHWMSVDFTNKNEIKIFLNSAHPFFLPYLEDKEVLELLQKFVISLALAEKMARETSSMSVLGLIDPSDFRDNMNKVLRYASEIKEEYNG